MADEKRSYTHDKTEGGLYRSRLKASKNYDSTMVDSVRLRVYKGWREVMQEYVADSDKYKSVNDMICHLIAEEIGLDYPVSADERKNKEVDSKD